MKKLAFLFVAAALTLGACGKKKDTSTPATGGDMGNPTGGDAYGADAYGAPAPMPEGGEGNPCGGAANPCG
jgi:hypothetical protein